MLCQLIELLSHPVLYYALHIFNKLLCMLLKPIQLGDAYIAASQAKLICSRQWLHLANSPAIKKSFQYSHQYPYLQLKPDTRSYPILCASGIY